MDLEESELDTEDADAVPFTTLPDVDVDTTTPMCTTTPHATPMTTPTLTDTPTPTLTPTPTVPTTLRCT